MATATEQLTAEVAFQAAMHNARTSVDAETFNRLVSGIDSAIRQRAMAGDLSIPIIHVLPTKMPTGAYLRALRQDYANRGFDWDDNNVIHWDLSK